MQVIFCVPVYWQSVSTSVSCNMMTLILRLSTLAERIAPLSYI